MTDTTTTDTTEMCETILRTLKDNNEDRGIWPTKISAVDSLLARQPELIGAYREVHEKLVDHPHALTEFWGVLLTTVALHRPERSAEARTDRDRLVEVNDEIASVAAELAQLLEERAELRNTSGFRDGTHYSVFRIIDAAANGNGHYRMYLREPLQRLSAQYDLKYWPTPAEFAQEIADDASVAETFADDPLTKAATQASRASKADFFKALFASIDENRKAEYGYIPDDFKLTDETLASLANCALDLGPDDGVDGAYVKRLRQRERARAAHAGNLPA